MSITATSTADEFLQHARAWVAQGSRFYNAVDDVRKHGITKLPEERSLRFFVYATFFLEETWKKCEFLAKHGDTWMIPSSFGLVDGSAREFTFETYGTTWSRINSRSSSPSSLVDDLTRAWANLWKCSAKLSTAKIWKSNFDACPELSVSEFITGCNEGWGLRSHATPIDLADAGMTTATTMFRNGANLILNKYFKTYANETITEAHLDNISTALLRLKTKLTILAAMPRPVLKGALWEHGGNGGVYRLAELWEMISEPPFFTGNLAEPIMNALKDLKGVECTESAGCEALAAQVPGGKLLPVCLQKLHDGLMYQLKIWAELHQRWNSDIYIAPAAKVAPRMPDPVNLSGISMAAFPLPSVSLLPANPVTTSGS